MSACSSATPPPVRVLLAAADPSVRQSLRAQLRESAAAGQPAPSPLAQVIGEASGGRAAAELARLLQPEILLLDSPLAPDFAREFRQPPTAAGRPATGIVLLVAETGVTPVLEAFSLGATGVVARASLAQLWRTGIESILAGNLWIGEDSLPPLLHALLGQAVLGQAVPGQAVSGQAVPATPAVPPPGGLTRREREIAARIARGLPNKHVAREFSIRERTVKHHLTNIFRKLGISSRLELALLMRDRSPALLSGLLAGADLLSGSDGLC